MILLLTIIGNALISFMFVLAVTFGTGTVIPLGVKVFVDLWFSANAYVLYTFWTARSQGDRRGDGA